MAGMVGSMCTMHTFSLFHTAKPSGFRSGPSSSVCKDRKYDDPDTSLRNYISVASPEDRKQLFERYQSKMKEMKAKRSLIHYQEYNCTYHAVHITVVEWF